MDVREALMFTSNTASRSSHGLLDLVRNDGLNHLYAPRATDMPRTPPFPCRLSLSLVQCMEVVDSPGKACDSCRRKVYAPHDPLYQYFPCVMLGYKSCPSIVPAFGDYCFSCRLECFRSFERDSGGAIAKSFPETSGKVPCRQFFTHYCGNYVDQEHQMCGDCVTNPHDLQIERPMSFAGPLYPCRYFYRLGCSQNSVDVLGYVCLDCASKCMRG